MRGIEVCVGGDLGGVERDALRHAARHCEDVLGALVERTHVAAAVAHALGQPARSPALTRPLGIGPVVESTGGDVG